MASTLRRQMKKTGPVKVVATKQAKSFIKEVMKDVLSESEEVHSVSSDDEVPPLREDITAFSSFKQQLLHDCSTTDAELDLSGGNSLSNWWSDTDDEDGDRPETKKEKLLQSLTSTLSTTGTASFASATKTGPSARPTVSTAIDLVSPERSTVSSAEAAAEAAQVDAAETVEHQAHPEELVLRRGFYLALRRKDAGRQLQMLQARLPQAMEFQTLHAQVALALEFVRDAEFARGQLWQSFCRSPGRVYCDEAPAGAAGQTQRNLRQARRVLASLPSLVAAQWDPRTSGDLLGRLSFAPPARLLASLCDTVEGTPSLKGPTECMQQALLVA